MWCKTCNLETSEKICEVCGSRTEEDIPAEIFWCDDCKVPVIHSLNQCDKGICPLCKSKMKYLTVDLRPVFPEERLLLEILLEKEENEFIEKSIWASDNRFYIDDKKISISNQTFKNANVNSIVKKLNLFKANNSFDYL